MDHINPDTLRDQPLFLDEPPQPPKRVQPDTSHVDGLFADEDTLPAFVGRAQAHGGLRDAWQAVVGSSSDAQARSYATTSLFIALILTAAAIGFAVARAFLN